MTKSKCSLCGGFGYLDDDGDVVCPECTGDGVVPGEEDLDLEPELGWVGVWADALRTQPWPGVSFHS